MDKELQLLIDGHHGIYIPQLFANYYGERVIADDPEKGEDLGILKCGPEHPDYWEAWDSILNGTYTDDHGGQFTLYQSGDLWLVPEGYLGEYPE